MHYVKINICAVDSSQVAGSILSYEVQNLFKVTSMPLQVGRINDLKMPPTNTSLSMIPECINLKIVSLLAKQSCLPTIPK